MTTALILFLVILLFSLLLADMGWSNVLSTSRNDVVFADRNRAYGAYRIRQEHHRVLIISFVSAMGLAGGLALAPRLFSSPTMDVTIPPMPDVVDVVLFDPREKQDDQIKADPTPPKPPTGPEQKYDAHAVTAIDVDTTTESTLVDTMNVTASRDPLPGGAGGSTPTGVGSTSTGSTGGSPSGDDGEGPRYMNRWKLDEQPEFPGGEAGLDRFFTKNLEYPELSEVIGEHGTVWVEFVVDMDGSVTGARIAKSVSKGLDAEALRVIRKMPRWKPGIYQNEPVPVLYQQKIVFALDQ